MTTPLMNLFEIVTGLGGDSPAAAWNKIIQNFQSIDSHNHTSGNGARITVGALNIDNDLTLNAFSLTNSKQVVFVNQASPLTTSFGLYVENGNLIYRSATGSVAFTTNNGNSIAGTSGNIDNMGLAQTVNFSLPFYQFYQNTAVFGILQSGGIAIGSNTTANPLTFVSLYASPTTGYTLTFPAADPDTNKVLWSSNPSGDLIWVDGLKKSGTISTNQAIIAASPTDLTGLTLAANQVMLGTGGTPTSGAITNTYIDAAAAIAGTKISPNFGAQNVVTTGTLSAGATTVASLGITGALTVAGITSTAVNNFSNSSAAFTVAGPSTFTNSVTLSTGNNLTVGGSTTLTGTISANGSINTNFIPVANGTQSLGSSGNRWNANLNTLDIGGSAAVAGTFSANGNTVLGNEVTDTVTYNARINSAVLPLTNAAHDLGSPSLRWGFVYCQAADIAGSASISGDFSVSGNTTIGNSSSDTVTFNATPSGQIGGSSYTPVATSATNTGTVTASSAIYTRVGNMVIVSGTAFCSSSSLGTVTFNISLPIGVQSPGRVFGTCSSFAGAGVVGAGVPGTAFITLFNTRGTTGHTISYIYQYMAA